MKHHAKVRPGPLRRSAAGRALLRADVAEPAVEADAALAESAAPLAPLEGTRAAQTDIERANERKSGSVESLAADDAAAGITAFIETAGDGVAEGPLPT